MSLFQSPYYFGTHDIFIYIYVLDIIVRMLILMETLYFFVFHPCKEDRMDVSPNINIYVVIL